jgi:hypothetical protein
VAQALSPACGKQARAQLLLKSGGAFGHGVFGGVFVGRGFTRDNNAASCAGALAVCGKSPRGAILVAQALLPALNLWPFTGGTQPGVAVLLDFFRRLLALKDCEVIFSAAELIL